MSEKRRRIITPLGCAVAVLSMSASAAFAVVPLNHQSPATESAPSESESSESATAAPDPTASASAEKPTDTATTDTSAQAQAKAANIQPGDEVLVGDWDKDGKSAFGVRRGSKILLASPGQPVGSYASYTFNTADGTPVVGTWGTKTDTVAIHHGTTVDLRRWFTDGSADRSFTYGNTGDELYSGDWAGTGYSGPVARRGNTFHVRSTANTGIADFSFTFAQPGGQVLTGDFNGDGKDTVAVRHGDTVQVLKTLADFSTAETITLGSAEAQIVAGDFNGDGTDTIEVISDTGGTAADKPADDAPADDATNTPDATDSATETPDATDSPSDKPTDAETSAPAEDNADDAAAITPTDGKQLVIGKDLKPGVYRVVSKAAECSLSVLHADGETQSGRVQGGPNSQVYLTLGKDDKISVTGCSIEDTSTKEAPANAVPADGEWLVGTDVQVGKYKVEGGEACFATVLANTDRDADIVTSAEGSDAELVVSKGQVISSDGCTWSKLP